MTTVVITGGSGFLGQRLAARLLETGLAPAVDDAPREPVDRLTLADLQPPDDTRLGTDPRVDVVTGDVASPELRRAIAEADGDLVVFHLASMVSAGCEADFDAALTVNLDGTRAVLEAARAHPGPTRLVFASSIATFDGLRPDDVASDDIKLLPETTYGVTKAICELLVNDYSRKGFLDGRSARLPTVIVRPGRPNRAATGWASSIFREPLNHVDMVVPVAEDLSLPVAGYRSVIDNLIRTAEVPAGRLGPDRALNLPSIDATPRSMIAALQAVASDASIPLGRIEIQPDPDVSAFFAGWAGHAAFERATALGMTRDESLEAIVRDYVADYLPQS